MRVLVLLPLVFLQPATAQVHVPDWAGAAVWYQIYPERFCNGDPTNDPTCPEAKLQGTWQVSPWTK